MLARVLGPYDDYLVAFVSSQLSHAVAGFDMVLDRSHPAFSLSGLKVSLVIRVGKVASISRVLFAGPLGHLDQTVFDELIRRLTGLLNDPSGSVRPGR